jgi:hypothetical protein
MRAWKYKPNEAQELLLKACLLRGEDSVRAWETWISRVDIDNLDGGSIRLLPLLYVSLKAQGIKSPELLRFKGVYRHDWYRNQLLVRNITPVLSTLEEAGIQTLLLKGAALIHGYYADYGVRPMGDLDLLVHPSDAWKTMEMLRAMGWVPGKGRRKYREEIVEETREKLMFSPEGGHHLDLHWHALASHLDPNGSEKTDAVFWSGARSIQFHGVTTAVPDPADLLLHVCIHGSEGQAILPPLRWVADSFVLIQKAGADLNWERLMQQAKEHHLSPPLCDTLGYLSEVLEASIPEAVLNDLRAIPVSRKHQLQYAIWTTPVSIRESLTPPATPWEALQSHGRGYSEWLAAEAASGKPNRSLVRYLQESWELESPADVPRTIWRRIVKKVTATVKSARNRHAIFKSG